jgi:hypothetical protein
MRSRLERELGGPVELNADLNRNATIRALLLGGATALGLRASGASRIGAGLIGAALAWESRAARRERAELARLAREAHDAALIGAWLGQHTPTFGEWALESDTAVELVRLVDEQPASIVEFGSGDSTLIIAQRLAHHDSGHLHSIDHLGDYQERIGARLERAGLRDRVTFVHAPLVDQSIAGREVNWYDPEILERALDGVAISTALIDGPPSPVEDVRWPALSFLAPRWTEEARLLIDDGRRDGETNFTRGWADDHPEWRLFWLDTRGGAWLLRRDADATPPGDLARRALQLARRINPHPATTAQR